eukprot:12188124-Karenia_brevis.AAC.1
MHPDTAIAAMEKEGVEVTNDVRENVNNRFRYVKNAVKILTNAKLLEAILGLACAQILGT